PTAAADRTVSFALKEGVGVYGGFAGTETLRSQRDWAAHPTVLSGDIGTPGDASDNSYHVVSSDGLTAAAVLDGFTVTAGNATGITLPERFGGGMYDSSSSPTVRNVTFTANSATGYYGDYGGGMYNHYSSPVLTNVTFASNSANAANSGGGGMFNDQSSPVLTNVT